LAVPEDWVGIAKRRSKKIKRSVEVIVEDTS
jgi:hypothetical protein